MSDTVAEGARLPRPQTYERAHRLDVKLKAKNEKYAASSGRPPNDSLTRTGG